MPWSRHFFLSFFHKFKSLKPPKRLSSLEPLFSMYDHTVTFLGDIFVAFHPNGAADVVDTACIKQVCVCVCEFRATIGFIWRSVQLILCSNHIASRSWGADDRLGINKSHIVSFSSLDLMVWIKVKPLELCEHVCGFVVFGVGRKGNGCLDDPGTLASGALCNRWIIQGSQERQTAPRGRDHVAKSHLRWELPSLHCRWTNRRTNRHRHPCPHCVSAAQQTHRTFNVISLFHPDTSTGIFHFFFLIIGRPILWYGNESEQGLPLLIFLPSRKLIVFCQHSLVYLNPSLIRWAELKAEGL